MNVEAGNNFDFVRERAPVYKVPCTKTLKFNFFQFIIFCISQRTKVVVLMLVRLVVNSIVPVSFDFKNNPVFE